MPHAIVEHSGPGNLAASDQTIADTVFTAMEASGLFGSEDIKVRIHPAAATRNGAANYSFVHAQLRIMPGRSSAQKKDCAQRVADAIRALDGSIGSITVEVRDIDADAYAKLLA